MILKNVSTLDMMLCKGSTNKIGVNHGIDGKRQILSNDGRLEMGITKAKKNPVIILQSKR